MPGEDDFPTFEIERRRRGWKIIQVQADGRRSFFTQGRWATEEEARAYLERGLPRLRKLWARMQDRSAL
jgi:hypothetical protein